MRPFAASVCTGQVRHHRHAPTVHEFTYPVQFVWFDPDDPGAVARAHPLWSARRAAPARFRRSDYGDGSTVALGDQARDDLAGVLGERPTGPVRVLTQWRRWGWLFNPLSVYVVWHDDPDHPVGAVLEVTNTPWKERHRYAVVLRRDGDGRLVADVDKVLHVSPFLDEAYRYHLTIDHRAIDHRTADRATAEAGEGGRLDVALDVVDASGTVVLSTGMRLRPEPVGRAALGAALWRGGFPTHRVSAAIHVQAARLWRARVPFVAHPRRRAAAPSVEVAR